MVENKLNVSLVRGGNSITNSEYDNYIDIIKDCELKSKINICRSLLKIEITRLVTPILKEAKISSFETTNILIDDIDLLAFVSLTHRKFNPLLTKLIYGSLYRIAVEVSSITDKDYAQYINSIYDEINSISNNIVQLLNS